MEKYCWAQALNRTAAGIPRLLEIVFQVYLKFLEAIQLET